MRILALIPARSGSKRVPNKNIRLLGGKPLIVWTIEAAQGISAICDILVSTDSIAIQLISSNAGARVPWLRPSELATDEAASVDVAIHALENYESECGEVDGLLLLQPTSPFRTKKYIAEGIGKYLAGGGDSVIGVTPVRERPSLMVTIENDQINRLDDQSNVVLSRDLNDLYIINGSFYLTSPSTLRTRKSFHSYVTKPLICDSIIDSLDIDTEMEFEFAERFYNENLRADLT